MIVSTSYIGMLRAIAATIYLVVDILYVLMSRSYYSSEVYRVQGSPMKVGVNKMWAAVASYTALVAGWYVLVAPMIERLGSSSASAGQAALYGMVYGLAVYGVFNFTNYVMFLNYSLGLVIRDTLWGVTWLTVFSTLYWLVAVRRKQ